MIRLTVMYNLPEGTDEEEFLLWRLSEHQENNAQVEGVLRTDFSRIDRAWPYGNTPPYRFMTTADWEDWESFEKGFYNTEMQASLEENTKKITDAVFLISEVLTETINDTG